ncbi:hypothetical protein Q5530_28980 [Saccharothrix sp. BKS2]|uniref:hypothetical protein n=1 Tax=Saccharothrix sp. BKS2 TaxID=3064400 RepID=UPI0039EBA687
MSNPLVATARSDTTALTGIDPDFAAHVRGWDYRAPEDVEVTDELEDALLRYW